MKSTTNEGVPYALDTDSAGLPPEMQQLLLGQDGRFDAWNSAFGLIGNAPGFSARCTVDGSLISNNGLQTVQFDTIDYDRGLNGGSSGIGTVQWNQPTGDGPSWWVFGTQVYWSATQAPATSNLIYCRINVTDVDPNSTSGATLNYYDTGNADAIDIAACNGLTIVTLAHFRNDHAGAAQVYFFYRDTAASQQKHYRVGSRFWGFRVGNG